MQYRTTFGPKEIYKWKKQDDEAEFQLVEKLPYTTEAYDAINQFIGDMEFKQEISEMFAAGNRRHFKLVLELLRAAYDATHNDMPSELANLIQDALDTYEG
jgi:predicted patatin/cPLA2 family phospholipase